MYLHADVGPCHTAPCEMCDTHVGKQARHWVAARFSLTFSTAGMAGIACFLNFLPFLVEQCANTGLVEKIAQIPSSHRASETLPGLGGVGCCRLCQFVVAVRLVVRVFVCNTLEEAARTRTVACRRCAGLLHRIALM